MYGIKYGTKGFGFTYVSQNVPLGTIFVYGIKYGFWLHSKGFGFTYVSQNVPPGTIFVWE